MPLSSEFCWFGTDGGELPPGSAPDDRGRYRHRCERIGLRGDRSGSCMRDWAQPPRRGTPGFPGLALPMVMTALSTSFARQGRSSKTLPTPAAPSSVGRKGRQGFRILSPAARPYEEAHRGRNPVAWGRFLPSTGESDKHVDPREGRAVEPAGYDWVLLKLDKCSRRSGGTDGAILHLISRFATREAERVSGTQRSNAVAVGPAPKDKNEKTLTEDSEAARCDRPDWPKSRLAGTDLASRCPAISGGPILEPHAPSQAGQWPRGGSASTVSPDPARRHGPGRGRKSGRLLSRPTTPSYLLACSPPPDPGLLVRQTRSRSICRPECRRVHRLYQPITGATDLIRLQPPAGDIDY